jgi:hypothetical protein
VVLVQKDHPKNYFRFTFYARVDNNQKQLNKNASPMCYIEHQWWRYRYSNPSQQLELVECIQYLAQYNTYNPIFDTPLTRSLLEQIADNFMEALQGSISRPYTPEPPVDEPIEPDSDKDSDETNILIWHTPLPSTMSVTIAVTTSTTRTNRQQELEYANPPEVPNPPLFTNLREVQQVFQQAVGRDQTSSDPPNQPFRGGRFPFGGPGGPGGPQGPDGPPGAGGGPLAAPQQPINLGCDMKPTGTLPQMFNGTREQAKDFIKEVLAYLWLNEQVTGFRSLKYKIAFTLTLISRPQVAAWKKHIGEVLDWVW